MDMIKIIFPPVIVAAVVGAVTALTIEWYRNRLRTLSRYHESQFTLYNALWNSLYDLKLAGDSLWEIADAYNLGKFIEQLEKTDYIINTSALLIEENHLQELKRLIQIFEDYEFGKKGLIEFRKGRSYSQVRQHQIEEMIHSNARIKEQYDYLIVEVARSLRSQLRRP